MIIYLLFPNHESDNKHKFIMILTMDFFLNKRKMNPKSSNGNKTISIRYYSAVKYLPLRIGIQSNIIYKLIK